MLVNNKFRAVSYDGLHWTAQIYIHHIDNTGRAIGWVDIGSSPQAKSPQAAVLWAKNAWNKTQKNPAKGKRKMAKTKLYYIVGKQGASDTAVPSILCWDSEAAKKAGVFNLCKMSWKKKGLAKYPIFFNDVSIARIFSSKINGPKNRFFFYTASGKVDPDAFGAVTPKRGNSNGTKKSR